MAIGHWTERATCAKEEWLSTLHLKVTSKAILDAQKRDGCVKWFAENVASRSAARARLLDVTIVSGVCAYPFESLTQFDGE
ncbi:hypothetical protein SLEP1_g27281 [Rubroshorea leprosula]|uniref:Uncharacterized protein n=1 Tax=Rubroshorea leprosula TaxID=152421 RepID=A0AAV5JZL1_9ROSI|nr:hypothetical protein SLEP1_g27281 [Rubroshorea leprosula]